jgi:hypothetical protein
MTTATIYDIFRSSFRYGGERHYGEFGVEIETESLKKYEYPDLKFWDCVKDNSLRNYGVEYVLKAPMDQAQFSHALNEFSVCNKRFSFLRNEVSTSVHVHLNFLNDSFLTLANFFTAYALVENLLVVYSGPDRLSNLFCLPMRDAEGVVTSIQGILNAVNKKMWKSVGTHPDYVKYGGINTAPLNKLGTIEIRTFRGETDTKIIGSWIDLLMKLKQYARRNHTPLDILNRYKEVGAGIVDEIFGGHADLLKCEGYDKLIRENLFYAATFATCSKNWSQFGVYKIKKVYKEKLTTKLEEMSFERFKNSYNELNWAQRTMILELYARENPDVVIVDQEEDI